MLPANRASAEIYYPLCGTLANRVLAGGELRAFELHFAGLL